MKSPSVCRLITLLMSGVACFAVAGPTSSPIPDTVFYHGKPLDFWVHQLKDDNALAREEAVSVLADAGLDAASALPAVKDLLKDSAAKVRLQAAVAVWKIGRQGDAAAPVLIDALKNSNRNHRLLALQILGRIGGANQEAASAILGGLADPDAAVRQRSVEALERISLPVVPGLLERLRDRDPNIRKECVVCLGRIGAASEDVRPRLTDALKDDDKQVRVAAAGALLRMDRRDAEAITALIDNVMGTDAAVRGSAGELLLEVRPRPKEADAAYAALLKPENNPNLRLGAAEALWEVYRQSKEILPVLIELLKSADANIRQRSLSMMAVLGPDAKSALPDLLALLKGGSLPYGAQDVFVQMGPAAVPPLIEMLRDKGGAAGQASNVLGYMGPEAGPDMIKLLEDPDAQVRANVLNVLRQEGPSAPGALPALIVAVSDKETSPHWMALNAVGAADPGQKTAVPVLLEAVRQKDINGRWAALQALFRFRLDAETALPTLNEAVKDNDPLVRPFAAKLRWRIDHNVGPALEIFTPLLTDQVNRLSAMHTIVEIAIADKEGVPALMACIRNLDPPMKVQALLALEQAGPAAKPMTASLTEVLKNSDVVASSIAARTLARLGADAKSVVPALAQGLNTPDAYLAMRNLEALSLYGNEAKPAAPRIRALLNSPNIYLRTAAAEALCPIDPSAKDAAVDALIDDLADPALRPANLIAAVALLHLNPPDPRGMAALKAALQDPDANVRANAMASCAKAGPAAKPLLPMLEQRYEDKTDPLRVPAALAIWKVEGRPEKAVAVLAESLKESPHYMERFNASLRLKEMGSEASAAVPALLDALKDRASLVRTGAEDALRKIDPEAADKAGIP